MPVEAVHVPKWECGAITCLYTASQWTNLELPGKFMNWLELMNMQYKAEWLTALQSNLNALQQNHQQDYFEEEEEIQISHWKCCMDSCLQSAAHSWEFSGGMALLFADTQMYCRRWAAVWSSWRTSSMRSLRRSSRRRSAQSPAQRRKREAALLWHWTLETFPRKNCQSGRWAGSCKLAERDRSSRRIMEKAHTRAESESSDKYLICLKEWILRRWPAQQLMETFTYMRQ